MTIEKARRETIAPRISPRSVPQETYRAQGAFGVHGERFTLATDGLTPTFYDVTELALAVVERSGIQAGMLTASTRHTTCAMVVQEAEPLLLIDLADRLRRYAGEDEFYRHNDFSVRTVNMTEDESPNGHAHCQHLLLGASVTLPVVDGQLVLGQWQRLFLVELDRPRVRQYSIQVMGIKG